MRINGTFCAIRVLFAIKGLEESPCPVGVVNWDLAVVWENPVSLRQMVRFVFWDKPFMNCWNRFRAVWPSCPDPRPVCICSPQKLEIGGALVSPSFSSTLSIITTCSLKNVWISVWTSNCSNKHPMGVLRFQRYHHFISASTFLEIFISTCFTNFWKIKWHLLLIVSNIKKNICCKLLQYLDT